MKGAGALAAAAALGLCVSLASALGAEIGPLAPPGTPAVAFPKPSRPVAEIISPIWATEKERDGVDEFGQVSRALGLAPGMAVADIGAGSGYYAVRLARLLGPAGRVLAQDVTPRYLADLAARVRREKLGNVMVVRGEPHDARLPAGSVDVALLVHMYHEIDQPFGLLHNLVPALRPGGRVGIVDLDRPTSQHGTPRALLACELTAVGFRQVDIRELSGDVGYLAVFEPPASDARLPPAAVKPCPVSGR